MGAYPYPYKPRPYLIMKNEYKPYKSSEIIYIYDEPNEVSEVIDITNPNSVFIPIPVEDLKNYKLPDIKTLKTYKKIPGEERILIEVPKHKVIEIIEIPSFIEPAPVAKPHPTAKVNRKLPWKAPGTSLNSFVPGEYLLPKITQEEIRENQARNILSNCKRFSKSRIANNAESQDLASLAIELNLSLLFFPVKIRRQVKVPLFYTFSQLSKIISTSFNISSKNFMFIFYNSENQKVFLNNPNKSDSEKNADLQTANQSKIIELISLEYSEFYYISESEDPWYIIIKIKKIVLKEENEQIPICLGGNFPCPPATSSSEFYEFFRILSQPDSENYQEMLEKYKHWKSSKFNKSLISFL